MKLYREVTLDSRFEISYAFGIYQTIRNTSMKHGDNAETLSAFEIITEIFADEKAAIDCLASWRWEKGHDCPHCGVIGESKPWKQRYGHWLCNACRKVHSVRVGTIFHDSKISLRKWFFVMYAHQTARKGVSALEISKLIGVTKQTAWFMLHRLHEAYGTELDAVKKTIGAVEVDEVFLGGLEHNKHANKKLHPGGSTGGKQAVIGLQERETGRVIMLPINDRTKKTLQGVITKLVQPGTKIYTDEAVGYKGVHHKGYEHEWVKHPLEITH